MDLERRIALLEDREKIKELRATYCFMVDDDQYAELVNNHFTTHAGCDFRIRLGDMEPMISEGSVQVLAFFQDVVASLLKDMTHTTHNHRITVDGDTASGDCYFELTAREPNSSTPMVGAGRYFDEFQRVGDNWRFSQRNADIFYIVPLEQGW
ncbi:MAG: nuclear transport factor 2 family protein [Gammaproteobacteria bacterium]|jgi:ketosteroid isomerase-like protein|nr:nuclear transport factor 2 family protein [Gammaproteobacteria bacterium]MBT4492654.1 nuclear transport factor 2 family protein [Gammaproteobacteria bacterium]